MVNTGGCSNNQLNRRILVQVVRPEGARTDDDEDPSGLSVERVQGVRRLDWVVDVFSPGKREFELRVAMDDCSRDG
ncbi:hypothetical protein Hanom_Chr17g01524251 [Helianthus anomalus]